MCSQERGRPSREQIWLLFIITATRHGDGGADLGSTKMRANMLVIGALFPALSCIPKPAWILIAEQFWGPSPLATKAAFHDFAWVAGGGQVSGTQEPFPNPGSDSTAVVPLCPLIMLPMLIYADVPVTCSHTSAFAVVCVYRSPSQTPKLFRIFPYRALQQRSSPIRGITLSSLQSKCSFFIRFVSLFNFSSLLFLCDISLCLH